MDVVVDVVGVLPQVGDVVVDHLDAGAAVVNLVDGDKLGLEELRYVEEDGEEEGGQDVDGEVDGTSVSVLFICPTI